MNLPRPILIDSTVLIDALRGFKQRRLLLASLSASGHALFVSAINVAEIYGGLRLGEESKTRSFLANFTALDVTPEIAKRAGDLNAGLKRCGQTRFINDMIVGATALENGFDVATDNTRDFTGMGLTLFPLP